MLTQSTISALMLLSWLELRNSEEPLGLRAAAHKLGLSPTYLAKLANQLARVGILRSWRGAHGGVTLARPADRITLREIIEAGQGPLNADFCGGEAGAAVTPPCAFHRAMVEAHAALTAVFERWTLADLTTGCPQGETGNAPAPATCRLRELHAALTGRAQGFQAGRPAQQPATARSTEGEP
jgi:Rrf2 family protein